MRNQTGRHTAPATMQSCPADNTSRFVAVQVDVWAASNIVIHTEIAQEIAAGWCDSLTDALTRFATAGRIGSQADLLCEIQDCIDVASSEVTARELRATYAYVLACPTA